MNVMPQLAKLLSLARTRKGLLVIVGALLLLNAGRLVEGKYAEIRQGVESRQALLGQYRMSTKEIDAVRARVKQLEARRKQFEARLFRGESEREVTSAMQIKLQELLSRVEMTPESLSPATRGGKGEGNAYGEASIKIRLSGTLDRFIRFLAALYKMDSLFRVENVTMKPFKKGELKIFLDLKGFYLLTEPPKSEPAMKKTKKDSIRKTGGSDRKGGSHL